MNLQQYAEAEGLKSAEAIRKRIKAHGRTIKEFTDGKGQLTTEGIKILDTWKKEAQLAQPTQPTKPNQPTNTTNQEANRANLEQLRQLVEALDTEKAAHAADVAEITRAVDALTAERDKLREERDGLRADLDELQNELQEQREELHKAMTARDVAAGQLDALTAERDRLISDCADWKKAAAQAHERAEEASKIADQAQQLHLTALKTKALTDGTERPRRGLFSWLKRKEQPEE